MIYLDRFMTVSSYFNDVCTSVFLFAKEMFPWKQLIWCLSVKNSLWLRPWHHYERHLFLSRFPLLDEHQNKENKLNLANCPTKWGRNKKSKCRLAVNVFKCSQEDRRVSRSSGLMFPCELCDSVFSSHNHYWIMCSCGSVVEHCVSSAKVVGLILREHMYWQYKCIAWMHCKSLWIKASAKCINVNVISFIQHHSEMKGTILNLIISKLKMLLDYCSFSVELDFCCRSVLMFHWLSHD